MDNNVLQFLPRKSKIKVRYLEINKVKKTNKRKKIPLDQNLKKKNCFFTNVFRLFRNYIIKFFTRSLQKRFFLHQKIVLQKEKIKKLSHHNYNENTSILQIVILMPYTTKKKKNQNKDTNTKISKSSKQNI